MSKRVTVKLKQQKENEMSKKKVFMYVLSVDFEGGDGADYFPIPEKRGLEKAKAHIDQMLGELLFASYPPPKVEILGLTEAQWKKAQKVGREQ